MGHPSLISGIVFGPDGLDGPPQLFWWHHYHCSGKSYYLSYIIIITTLIVLNDHYLTVLSSKINRKKKSCKGRGGKEKISIGYTFLGAAIIKVIVGGVVVSFIYLLLSHSPETEILIFLVSIFSAFFPTVYSLD